MKSIVLIRTASLALTVCLSGGVWAEDVVDSAAAAQEESTIQADSSAVDVVAVTENESVEVSTLGVAVNTADLANYRGGFDLVKNDMQLSGTVANNSTYNVVSGNNLISEGSFAQSNGFPTVVQNSGSNVLIQNATIINLHYE